MLIRTTKQYVSYAVHGLSIFQRMRTRKSEGSEREARGAGSENEEYLSRFPTPTLLYLRFSVVYDAKENREQNKEKEIKRCLKS